MVDRFAAVGSGVEHAAQHPRRLLVHRKGATRAFPDQPVLVPGSMGTASYVLVGTAGAYGAVMAGSYGGGR